MESIDPVCVNKQIQGSVQFIGQGPRPCCFERFHRRALQCQQILFTLELLQEKKQEDKDSYLQQFHAQSQSQAGGWQHLCSYPHRSLDWLYRRGLQLDPGCLPLEILRAGLDWSLPGKQVRQNSVEHCSYSRLVCRE